MNERIAFIKPGVREGRLYDGHRRVQEFQTGVHGWERRDALLRRAARALSQRLLMNILRICVLSLGVAFGAALSLPRVNAADDAEKKYVIENSRLRTLPRAANGHEYLLHVALPFSYGTDTAKRYPVLYTCDGNWSFVLVCGMYGGLYYDRAIPEYILVGIGYPASDEAISRLRLVDYLPKPRREDPAGKNSGHAAEFLQVLQKEIMPFVEKEYRVDPSYRVLAGGSAGGTFALYTMFTQPELFQGYIAISPSVSEQQGMPGLARKFAESGRPLPVSLFLSGAGEDAPDFLQDIQTFERQLELHKIDALRREFRLVDGLGHGGTGAESFSHGIRFAFRSYLERGKQP